jgi:Flp pilus assembly protein TadG
MVMVSRKRNVSRRGAVLVEAALVFPVLLLVTFGAIRYGWFFLKLQQITDTARCGARKAALYNVTQSEVTDIIRALLVGDNIIDSTDPLPVIYKITNEIGEVRTTTDVTGALPQEKITVSISIPAADVDILPIGLFRFEPADWHLRSSMTIAKEGVPPPE